MFKSLAETMRPVNGESAQLQSDLGWLGVNRGARADGRPCQSREVTVGAYQCRWSAGVSVGFCRSL